MEWLTDCSAREKEWIEGCAKKNTKAQELLFKNFFGFAMGISLRYLSDRALAQEVVNDAFLKIFNQLPRELDKLKSFRAWMRKLVVHTAIDHFRKEKRFTENISLDTYHDLAISDDALGNQSVEDILRLLDKLPPLWKAIFNLYEVEGFSHEEIAALLKIPASSSRAYLTKAKQTLRTLIITLNKIN